MAEGHCRTTMDLLPQQDSDEDDCANSERILIMRDTLSYLPDDAENVGVWIGAVPLDSTHNYFEVEILATGIEGCIAVGLCAQDYPLNQQPGWEQDSVAFHCKDGKLYLGRPLGIHVGPKCNPGDRIGCGINHDMQSKIEDVNPAAKRLVYVFFTRNGIEIGGTVVPSPREGFFPTVGMHSLGEEVRLKEFRSWVDEDTRMSVDGTEEDWSRLCDVMLNGQVLEYAGQGLCIRDVGLAQAKQPLNTNSHYFEIEIVDPGDCCYIAVGLARRDYPVCQQPGWTKGSIAYHADDGKLFHGSGMGDEFGPRCHKGDRMGCGILFPEDGYDWDYDAEINSNLEIPYPEALYHSHLEDQLLFDLDDTDSDDEFSNHRNIALIGPKVEVFFTRNGQLLGKRETVIPQGGFYPTIGMLSLREKVRVDLKPLTG